jgi:hypothetical protein
MKLNIYEYIFYILFRFSKIVAPKEFDSKDYADSAFLSLTLCVFFWTLSVLLHFKIWNALLDIKNNFLFFGGFFLLFFFYMNRWIFIRNEKYIEIETYYESKLKLNKLSVIILALFILFGSFSLFLFLLF